MVYPYQLCRNTARLRTFKIFNLKTMSQFTGALSNYCYYLKEVSFWDRYPTLVSVEYEEESEYDDEGSNYIYLSLYDAEFSNFPELVKELLDEEELIEFIYENDLIIEDADDLGIEGLDAIDEEAFINYVNTELEWQELECLSGDAENFWMELQSDCQNQPCVERSQFEAGKAQRLENIYTDLGKASDRDFGFKALGMLLERLDLLPKKIK
jgi:hypothetical protein